MKYREYSSEGPLQLVCEIVGDDQFLSKIGESLCKLIQTFRRSVHKHCPEGAYYLPDDLYQGFKDVG